MLDKLEKLEEKVNNLLTKLFTLLFSLFLKLIPQKIQNKFKTLKEASSSNSKSFVENQKKRGKLFVTEVKKYKDAFFNKMQEIQKYPVKDKAIEFKDKAIIFLKKSPKAHWRSLKAFIIPKLYELKKRIQALNNIYTKVTLGSIILLALSSTLLYHSGFKIYQSEYPNREPASVQEYDYRPDYRLYEKKTLKVLNVKVPVWSTSVEKIDSVTIDFSLRTSTRFARHYLLEYEYKLRDYFFTSMQPIVSDFPLEDEGKDIIKEKILEEINYFLQINNVEGEVEDVHILYIVGS